MQREGLRLHDQLHRRWRPALMAFFVRRVRNREEAEDLTQEVFVRMLNNAQPPGVPDAYVFQIAANLLTDRARRAKVRATYLQAAGEEEGIGVEPLDPHRIAAGRAQLAAVAAALEELSERQRAIFILYRIENMSQDAIAETFGISTSAVKKNIAKAMIVIMSRLREVT